MIGFIHSDVERKLAVLGSNKAQIYSKRKVDITFLVRLQSSSLIFEVLGSSLEE